MAILKAQDFDIEFCYNDLNDCNEIEYSFDIRLNGNRFLNTEIISKEAHSVKNGKFIFFDSRDEDWLYIFFVRTLATKKGNSYTTFESPEWTFKTITWKDKEKEKEKSWKEETVKTLDENQEIIDVPYYEMAKLFIPIWENDIDFEITFPSRVLNIQQHTSFQLLLKITFEDLQNFLEQLSQEMKQFYSFFNHRIEYLGQGKYQEKGFEK